MGGDGARALISTIRGGMAQEKCANYPTNSVLAARGLERPVLPRDNNPITSVRSSGWHYHDHFK